MIKFRNNPSERYQIKNKTNGLLMKKLLLTGTILAIFPTLSKEIHLSVQIPAMDTAEYHRPYVAAWLQDANKQLSNHLLVWYDRGDSKDNHDGEEWLKDLRRWWRRGGRTATMPIDGVSGATKVVGKHEINFAVGGKVIKNLSDGNYTLLVEAARENGGREVVEIPFSVPFTGEQSLSASGKSELGEVTVKLIP